MSPALIALLPQLIALLPTIQTGVVNLIGFIQDIRKAAKQTNEWTPEMENQFVDALLQRALDPKWQPDKSA